MADSAASDRNRVESDVQQASPESCDKKIFIQRAKAGVLARGFISEWGVDSKRFTQNYDNVAPGTLYRPLCALTKQWTLLLRQPDSVGIYLDCPSNR